MHDRSTDPLEAYRYVNLQGSARLAQQAAEAGVRRLVFLSSVKVNGEATIRHGFTENDIPRPRDSYGLSKLEAEKKLAEICSHSETELTVLRPPLIYGPGVKGNILALIRAIDRGIPLPIGAVRNLRTVLGIDNLVAAILLCLDHPDAAGSTFLVGDDRPVSSLELARSIANALGRNTRIISVPVTLLRLAGALFGRSAAVERISSSLVVDSSKIRERLGWRPVRSFEEGVMDMVHWYLTQRH